MSPNQAKCLKALNALTSPDGEMCVPFAPIQQRTKLDRKTVRRCVRALARRGLAAFHRPLWSDDGLPAGAGYCISRTGRAIVAHL